MKFSKTYLESLAPQTKIFLVSDDAMPGLGLAVHPSGKKTFFWRRHNKDFDTGRMTIGIWRDGRIPDMTIMQASDRAAELNALFNAGINPADKTKGITFGDFFEIYYSDHAMVHKKSHRDDLSIHRNHLGPLDKLSMAVITPGQILDIFTSIIKAGHAAHANKTLALMRIVFRLAVDWGYLPDTHRNPAARIKKARTVCRDQRLEPGQFPAFIRALEAYPHRDPRDVLLLCLFTAQRVGDICAMRWDDVSLADGTWLIPDPKSGHPSRLPLAEEALTILRRRLEMQELSDRREPIPGAPNQARDAMRRELIFPFVFRSRGHGGKIGHIIPTTITGAWNKITATAGITGLHVHDLRRTFGTINATNGTNMAVTSKLLSHRNISTTAKIYTIVEQDPMREAVNRTADTINKLSKTGGK